MKEGKHLHVIQLQSYRMSLLPYVNKEDDMDDQNRQFRIQFPKIRKVITFTKIRRLKNDMVKCFLQDYEISDKL